MVELSPVRARAASGLTGRRSESDVLDGLVEAVRAGESRALLVRGEPGVGKTALLEYVGISPLSKRRNVMTATTVRSRSVVLLTASVAVAVMLISAGTGRADSTPVGPLPAGPVSSTTTKPGLLVAVALPRARQSSGLVWRLARRYNAGVVRQVSEADVGGSVVVVFKVVGRGDTSLVFALTRGDASAKAVKSATHKVHST
jgi:hypothetical protein